MTSTAGALIRQRSYENRGRRLGFVNSDKSTTISQQMLKQFSDCKFWRWNLLLENHQTLYKSDKCQCFNRIVKWPTKNNAEHLLYPWQREIYNALQSSNKLLATLTARGVGASEFLLRYIMWNCVKEDRWLNKNFPVAICGSPQGSRDDVMLGQFYAMVLVVNYLMSVVRQKQWVP